MSDVPALRLAGVERGYNPGRPAEVRVLRGADLTLRPGEVAALVAPSGAGTSTLLHIAGLLDRPDAGAVEIAGVEATGLSDARRTGLRRRAAGFVYQFHHLLQEFSAEENVALPLLADGMARGAALERARALLADVGLAERAAHRPSPSAAAWPTVRRCCWRTSRRAISIPRRRSGCSACSPTSRGAKVWRR